MLHGGVSITVLDNNNNNFEIATTSKGELKYLIIIYTWELSQQILNGNLIN